jgi:organic radical activating enzyme
MSKRLKDIIWIKNDYKKTIEGVKELLDSTGKGFCLAKFTQATIHLGQGTVHSCHHPKTHTIPLSELRDNPNALFNTSILQTARQEMLDGERPSECDYCWRIEDKGETSDRHFKSLSTWALPLHDKIVESKSTDTFYPTSLEVDFSNVCNLACSYCGPEYSSKWVESLKRHGPIKLLENTKNVIWAQGYQDLDNLNYKHSEENPYVTAFWKWFPEAYKHLKTYRITGGEPLMSKETFKSIEWLIDNPNPELEFSINSNLCVADKLWEQFKDGITRLIANNSVKKMVVYTSVDTWGSQAEYIRTGMDFELLKRRYLELLEIPGLRVTTMCTFNIMSIIGIKKLLEWHRDLKFKLNPDHTISHYEQKFNLNLGGDISHTDRIKNSGPHHGRIGIDIPYLRHPTFLDARYANKELIEQYLVPALDYMASNGGNGEWGIHNGFEKYEIEKFKRVVMDIISSYKDIPEENTIINRAKFYEFVNEQDRRNGTNFLETFPEMSSFYSLCKEAEEQIKKDEK